MSKKTLVALHRRSRNDRCVADPRFRQKSFWASPSCLHDEVIYLYPYGRRRLRCYGTEFRGYDYYWTTKDIYDGPRHTPWKRCVRRILRKQARADGKRLIAECERE